MSGWGKLSDLVKQDLETWYNCTEISYSIKTEMARMYFRGDFKAWNCPLCGERVYFGEPRDWGDFQGVRQADYVSYPGDDSAFTPEFLETLCDDCRAKTPGNRAFDDQDKADMYYYRPFNRKDL